MRSRKCAAAHGVQAVLGRLRSVATGPMSTPRGRRVLRLRAIAAHPAPHLSGQAQIEPHCMLSAGPVHEIRTVGGQDQGVVCDPEIAVGPELNPAEPGSTKALVPVVLKEVLLMDLRSGRLQALRGGCHVRFVQFVSLVHGIATPLLDGRFEERSAADSRLYDKIRSGHEFGEQGYCLPREMRRCLKVSEYFPLPHSASKPSTFPASPIARR